MSSDNRLIAARYVQALFDLASEEKQHDNVKADMLMLGSILEKTDSLQNLLQNPVISRAEAEKAIATVLAALKASDLTKKFFALLARNRRLNITHLAIEQYLARLAESKGELTVDVTSAKPLSEEEKKILGQSISTATGKKVEIRTSENPELLGGLQVRVGSRMLDNSISGKLDRLKQTLTHV